MKSAGDPPPAPDPTTSANAQSRANINTAIANARLNRVNQTTPWGSIGYTQTGVDENGVPIYSSQVSLSPQQQALLEQQQHGQLTRSTLANTVLSNGSANISRPLDLSGLHGVYDQFAPGQSWAGNPQPPAAAAAAAPQGAPPQMPAPSAGPSSMAPPQGGQSMSNGAPNIQALVAALRNGSSGSPAGDPSAAGAAPEGGDPFGTWGNLHDYIGTNKPDLSKLPPEIAAQLQDEVRVDEGGAQTHNYSFNENPWGGFTDKDGKAWVQVGDPATNNAGDGGIKDRSKVVYKPGAGYVTTPDNLNDYGKGGIDWRMVLAVIGAGLGGAAMGLGADGAGLGGVAATDAAESGGTLALNSAGTGVAPYVGSGAAGAGAGSGALTNTMDTAGSSGFGGTTPVGNGMAPVTDLSVNAQQPSVWQQMMTNMQNGKGLLGMSPGQRAAVGGGTSLLSQMLTRGQGQGAKK